MRKTTVIGIAAILCMTALFGCTKEPEKTYKNEVTGVEMKESLKDQRPVAIMLGEGEKIPDSNIVYVYKLNDETKRLVLIKDWAKLKEIKTLEGSEPTAEQIAPAWNAVLITNTETTSDLPFLSGITTESIKGKDIAKFLEEKGISEKYDEYHTGGNNLSFEDDCDITTLSGSTPCTELKTGAGSFAYDEKDKKYRGDNGEEYKNIILQNAIYLGLDGDDYYNLNDSNREGWFIRDGYAAPVTWAKLVDVEPTKFYDADGKEVQLSEGNTLINIISQDDWDAVEIR